MSLRAAPSFSFALLCRLVWLGVHGRVCAVGCAQDRRAELCLCVCRGSWMLSEGVRAVVHVCVCVHRRPCGCDRCWVCVRPTICVSGGRVCACMLMVLPVRVCQLCLAVRVCRGVRLHLCFHGACARKGGSARVCGALVGVHDGCACVRAWVYTCAFTGHVHLQGCDGCACFRDACARGGVTAACA